MVIVPFDAKFTPNDADFRPFIKDELCEQGSMEYLALLGLQGLKRVLGNAQFTTSSRVQGQLDEYEENNNPCLLYTSKKSDRPRPVRTQTLLPMKLTLKAITEPFRTFRRKPQLSRVFFKKNG